MRSSGFRALLVVALALSAACTVDATTTERRADAGLRSNDAAPPRDTDASVQTIDASSPVPDAAEQDSCPRVRVTTSGSNLNIREEPNTSSDVIGSLANGTVVTVRDRVQGETVSGDSEWFEIEHQGTVGYISGAFAECTTDPASLHAPPTSITDDSVG